MSDQDPNLTRLMDQVRAAVASGTALEIRGGGSKRFYGEAASGALLDTRTLRGIRCYEPSELVITVRAGTTIAEVESALADCGQMLAFEPPRHSPGATVGGMVAAGLSGPARASAGAVRDHVLGVTLLTGNAQVLAFGGQVMKNVAGYDVSRLMAGSLGILGILCEVSLKVVPEAAAEATLQLALDQADAIRTLNRLRGQPVPLDASAWYRGSLVLRLRGAAAAVDAFCAHLQDTAGAHGLDADPEAYWHSLRDQHHEFFSAALSPGENLWRLSVPDTAAPLALDGESLLEWHGALRWWRTRETAARVRQCAAEAGGSATLYRGADRSCGVFAPLSAPVARIHAQLKQAFDPSGILNPGRMYPDL